MMIPALLLLFASNVAPQIDITDPGVIHVEVVDVSGNALPGVTVTLLDSAMKESGRPLITDMRGQTTVVLDGVPHGWYWLRFYLAGSVTEAFEISIGGNPCLRLPKLHVVLVPRPAQCF